MHTSLKLKSNLIVVSVCIAFAALVSVITSPFPIIPWALAAIFGVSAGILQIRSIALAPEAFRSAQTLLEVRAAFTSTAPGKQALIVQWALLPLLLGVSFWIDNPFGGGLGGFAVFMSIRDLVAIRAVVSLSCGTP